MLEINKTNIIFIVATSALLTVWVNEVFAEPEELQELDKDIKHNEKILSKINNTNETSNQGQQQMTSSTKTQNITLTDDYKIYFDYPFKIEQAITKYPVFNENITRVLTLQINFTTTEDDGKFTLDDLRKNGYYVNAKIKSDRYTDYMKFTFDDIVFKKGMIPIIIENNASKTDNGGDFRIDVWVNNFENEFVKALYPISRNATFASVDITELIKDAWEDNEEEGNNINAEIS